INRFVFQKWFLIDSSFMCEEIDLVFPHLPQKGGTFPPHLEKASMEDLKGYLVFRANFANDAHTSNLWYTTTGITHN
ncbi:MAG: hypothetical protein JXB49_08605, partial [Bacteroidales bacterium]|nr:hypothetical protein [Bacteroidales bacterium]